MQQAFAENQRMTCYEGLKLHLALILITISSMLIMYMVKCPPMTNKFTLSLKNAVITFDWDALCLHKSVRFVKD